MPPELTGQELRNWRRTHGIPLQIAARLLDRSIWHISRMERGQRPVRPAIAARVAAVVVPPRLTPAELRAWRLAHGWMVKTVARALGCGYPYICSQESGHRPISWATRCYVAAHPAPAVPVRIVSAGDLTRQTICGTLRAEAGTAAEVRGRLPYALNIITVRVYLRALVQEGRVVRYGVRGRWIYRATLRDRGGEQAAPAREQTG